MSAASSKDGFAESLGNAPFGAFLLMPTLRYTGTGGMIIAACGSPTMRASRAS